jgi:hypothetical protein
LHLIPKRVPVKKTAMHSATPKFVAATRRPEGLSGSWCISGLPVQTCLRDSLPTLSYSALFSSNSWGFARLTTQIAINKCRSGTDKYATTDWLDANLAKTDWLDGYLPSRKDPNLVGSPGVSHLWAARSRGWGSPFAQASRRHEPRWHEHDGHASNGLSCGRRRKGPFDQLRTKCSSRTQSQRLEKSDQKWMDGTTSGRRSASVRGHDVKLLAADASPGLTFRGIYAYRRPFVVPSQEQA